MSRMRTAAAKFRYAVVLAATCGCLSSPVGAHHSFAMYDRTKTLSLTGRLIRFIPGANHAQLVFELVDANGDTVAGEDGRPAGWVVETGPAAQIAEQGITVANFPVGTIISVSLNPLRDGRPVGVLTGPVIRCGVELPAGGCTAQTGDSFGGGP